MGDTEPHDERAQFSVYAYECDGTTTRELTFIGLSEAIMWARWLTETYEARHGQVVRIIITDGGDHTVFEWKYGKGVTWPVME